jgi:hypothetical protein
LDNFETKKTKLFLADLHVSGEGVELRSTQEGAQIPCRSHHSGILIS